MLRRLFVQIGFPWAVRALTFLILGCLIVACLVMKLRPRSSKGTSLIELKHFRDFPYVVFIAGQFGNEVSPCYTKAHTS